MKSWKTLEYVSGKVSHIMTIKIFAHHIPAQITHFARFQPNLSYTIHLKHSQLGQKLFLRKVIFFAWKCSSDISIRFLVTVLWSQKIKSHLTRYMVVIFYTKTLFRTSYLEWNTMGDATTKHVVIYDIVHEMPPFHHICHVRHNFIFHTFLLINMTPPMHPPTHTSIHSGILHRS